MYYAELYDKTKTYYFQDGKIADYDVIKNLFPIVDIEHFIAFTDYTGRIIISFELLNLKRTEYNISEEYSDEQALEAILEIMNTEPHSDVNDLTRIADAFEDLVVLNMPDEEE